MYHFQILSISNDCSKTATLQFNFILSTGKNLFGLWPSWILLLLSGIMFSSCLVSGGFAETGKWQWVTALSKNMLPYLAGEAGHRCEWRKTVSVFGNPWYNGIKPCKASHTHTKRRVKPLYITNSGEKWKTAAFRFSSVLALLCGRSARTEGFLVSFLICFKCIQRENRLWLS